MLLFSQWNGADGPVREAYRSQAEAGHEAEATVQQATPYQAYRHLRRDGRPPSLGHAGRHGEGLQVCDETACRAGQKLTNERHPL